MMRYSLFDDQETAFDSIIRDSIPHHPRLAHGNDVLKIHNLSGRQRCIRMRRAEAAVADIQQSTGNFLTRGIVEREFQVAVGRMTMLGTAISSSHNGFLRSLPFRTHRSAALPPFRIISASG